MVGGWWGKPCLCPGRLGRPAGWRCTSRRVRAASGCIDRLESVGGKVTAVDFVPLRCYSPLVRHTARLASEATPGGVRGLLALRFRSEARSFAPLGLVAVGPEVAPLPGSSAA